MNKRNITTFCNATSSSLCTAKNVLCMHFIRFTHFFNWLRIPKTLPSLFLPNANLNPDFQMYIASGEVSKPRSRAQIIYYSYEPLLGFEKGGSKLMQNTEHFFVLFFFCSQLGAGQRNTSPWLVSNVRSPWHGSSSIVLKPTPYVTCYYYLNIPWIRETGHAAARGLWAWKPMDKFNETSIRCCYLIDVFMLLRRQLRVK